MRGAALLIWSSTIYFGQRFLSLPKQTHMTSRILNFLPLLGALLLAACGPASRTDALLNDIESYINDAPDSARIALTALDTNALRTKRLRARYSLLRVQVMSRRNENITVPGLLDDASWFARHGSPDEKLKYWYLQGRIYYSSSLFNEAAVAFSQAEAYADQAQDQHVVGQLYVAFSSVYEMVFNSSKQREYAEKAYETFKRAEDPYAAPCLGVLAMAYHKQKMWQEADSLFREAIPIVENIPSALQRYLYDYARMKLLQPEPDPEGALVLLNRYRDIGGNFDVDEEGAYAYALELSGDRESADPIVAQLRDEHGWRRFRALPWLDRIDKHRGDYVLAYEEAEEAYMLDAENIQRNLEDSIAQSLREEADRRTAETRASRRTILILAGGVFFAMLSVILLLLLRKGKIQAERKRLVDLREQMQEELEKAQEENEEKAQQLSGQEDRIREMEENVAREREIYTRERVNRLRQLGELRSTFWWRERGRMRELDAIQRIKKEISFVYQVDNDSVSLIRRLDKELDGAVSELRTRLQLRGKPKEVLFLCCCILDLEPEMIAEIMDTSKANVYEKRSRLRARIRELNDPLLYVLVER